MSWGTGVSLDVGYGDPAAWGGPDNGIDLQSQTGIVGQSRAYAVSEDAYLAMIVVGGLILLWLMGGIVFKSVRL